ncbi:HTH-type transcriptional activator RamA [Nocardia sp. RB56]|uniref:HTH-type transcriptional activator RamA n=2 Tax=Nocardia aurantia TaxID=2585199 RepID=A0A7K0E151_9NOCA|nr:HTH-type transcriptional activator RamA [Nocardia aurantia]
MTRALNRVQAATGVSLAFGGAVLDQGDVQLRYFAGPTAGALTGVTLKVNEGLGGRSVALMRPIALRDYFESDRITHRYDPLIRVEGLRSLVAIPIIIARRPVAILYGAFRGVQVVGDRIQDTIAQEARALEHELVVRSAIVTREPVPEQTRLHEEIRSAHNQLRLLSRTITEPELRDAIEKIARRLARVDAPTTSTLAPLTAREVDVVSLAATGMANRQIATTLGLSLHTVKSYMKTTMSKLHAGTRLEAVVNARRAGIIP